MTGPVRTPAEEAPIVTDEPEYAVVVNHEEQYSIWQAGRQVPAGWHATGVTGSRRTCLDHIEEVWTDMRPLSLRQA